MAKKSRYKILFISSFLALVFCLSAGDVRAVDNQGELSVLIAGLQKRIVDIRVKLAISGGQEKIPVDFSFDKNLKLNDYGVEVVYLQTILKSEGVFCRQCRITGFFGPGTRQALVAFQQKYAKEILASKNSIKINALADSFTREKLNSILGGKVFLPAVAGVFDVVKPAEENLTGQNQLNMCFPSAPGVPQLLFPKNYQSNLPLSLTFSWTPPLNWGSGCPDQRKYNFQLDDNPDFSSPLVEISILFPQTSYFVSPGIMSPNNIYHWRLRAENGFKGGYVAGSFGVSFLPGVDLRVNNSNGPLTVNHDNSIVLSWVISQAEQCEASGDWSGKKSLSGSEKIEGLTSSKIFNMICSGKGGSAEDSVGVEVLPIPTLDLGVKIALNQQDWQDSMSGTRPLNGVDIDMAVSGNTTGSVNYKIDCESDGVWDKIFSGETEETEIIIDACDYSVLGAYRLLARAERAGMVAEKSIEVLAYESPSLDWEVISIERSPRTGLKSGEAVNYTAKVVNKGPTSSQEFRYIWLSDNVAQVSGYLPGLEIGETATTVYQTVFPAFPKIIGFRLDPDNEIVEYSKTNNFLSISSHK